MEIHGYFFMDVEVPILDRTHGVELLWNTIEFHKLCFRRIPWNSMSQYQTEFHGIELFGTP